MTTTAKKTTKPAKPVPQPKRARGRPPMMEDAQMRRFRMTDAHFEALAAWGDGNASEGLRRIIEAKLRRQKSLPN